MIRLLVAVPAAVLVLTAAVTAPPYRTGAPPGHTGGFGEGHCGACHFGGGGGDDAGSATIDAPSHYHAGQTYEITVAVGHPGLEAAGFQLSVRFADGALEGRQAGRLEPIDSRTQTAPGPEGVIYAGHTEAGALPAEPRVGRWTLRWTAPDKGDAVVFHLAANAANDDDSEFGDRIFLAHRRVDPCG
jgi:hypothetical protein